MNYTLLTFTWKNHTLTTLSKHKILFPKERLFEGDEGGKGGFPPFGWVEGSALVCFVNPSISRNIENNPTAIFPSF